MTTAQADAINKKYKVMEAELNALKATIRYQRDTINKQHIVIQTQTDTISKYTERIVYVKVDKDSINTQFSSLQDRPTRTKIPQPNCKLTC